METVIVTLTLALLISTVIIAVLSVRLNHSIESAAEWEVAANEWETYAEECKEESENWKKYAKERESRDHHKDGWIIEVNGAFAKRTTELEEQLAARDAELEQTARQLGATQDEVRSLAGKLQAIQDTLNKDDVPF